MGIRSVSQLVFWIGWAFVAFAFVRVCLEVKRRARRSRFDIILFLALLALPPIAIPPYLAIVQVFVRTSISLLPFSILLVTRRFRRASPAVLWFLASLAFAAGIVTLVVPDREEALLWRRWPFLGTLAGAVLVAVLLWEQTGRVAAGVQRKRLVCASLGASALSLAFVVSFFGSWSAAVGIYLFPHSRFLWAASFVCFFLAFTTPRTLLRRWQRAEHEHYLAKAASRDPEERGRQAPDDLLFGAVRAIGGSTVFIALHETPAPDGLTIRAATHPHLLGIQVGGRSEGLVNRVWWEGVGARGELGECEPELRAQFVEDGVSLLAAPIVAEGRRWGVVAVVQRRGALFPEDDLATLSLLARDAATSLDYAQLIIDRREHDRRLADKRIREIESRVALMLDSIKDYALIVVDATGRIATWQPGAEHLFGHAREQMMGRHGARLFDLTEEAFEAWLHDAGVAGVAEREGTCRRLDESTFVGRTVVRPLIDEPGEPPAFAVVTHDVTERQELEARMRQGQKMEAIGQLAGGIAHDFNNLLTAILGYADWLERDLQGDARASQVREIQRAAERAADLTSQLLAFSRRQARRPIFVDLSALIRDLLPMLRRLIGERIEIVDGTSEGLPAVYGDRSQLEQVVLNLVVNARDAMPGGGKITIRTGQLWVGAGASGTARSSGQHVLLEVVDTGTGMDAETRQRAFEPFFTTKEIGRGTGLGLSTVYGIVQQMDGTVEIETEMGRGTAFRLSFPSSDVAAAAPRQVAAADVGRGDETLLLVEDDAAVRTYLKQVLESHGYRVIAADSPRSALTMMQSFGEVIDLVISDVVMPGGTGPELVQLLGQKRPGLSALYISGHADAEFDAEALLDDAPELLQKPFSSSALLTRIRRILSAA